MCNCLVILKSIWVDNVFMGFYILCIIQFNLVLSFFLPFFIAIRCLAFFILVVKWCGLVFHWLKIAWFLFILLWWVIRFIDTISLDSPIKYEFMFKSTFIIQFLEISSNLWIVWLFIKLKLPTVTHKYCKLLWQPMT